MSCVVIDTCGLACWKGGVECGVGGVDVGAGGRGHSTYTSHGVRERAHSAFASTAGKSMCGRHREGGGVAWHRPLFPRINSHAEARKSAHSSNPHATTITHPAPHHHSVAAHTWCGLSCPHLTAVGFPRHTTPHLLTRHARGGQQCTRRVGGHVKRLQ